MSQALKLVSPILTIVLVVLLVRARRHVNGTTLVGPWLWMGFAVLSIGIVDGLLSLVAADATPAWAAPLRLMAAVTLFCPQMSVLGAKRPQDRGWHFVVATLWIVLALPALEALFLGSERMDTGAARPWFLWLLILIGLLNYLPTRFGLSAVLLSAAQVALLADHLPLVGIPVWGGVAWGGQLLMAAALSVALFVASRPRKSAGMSRLWLDFRDNFGALWALRILQQVNASARANGWPFALTWQGFVSCDNHAAATGESPALRQVMDNLLRRFVNPQWIHIRLDPTAKPDSLQTAVPSIHQE